MSASVIFEDSSIMGCVLGANDANLPYIEQLLGGELSVRGNRLDFPSADPAQEKEFLELMQRLQKLCNITTDITQPEILMEYQATLQPIKPNTPRNVINVLNRSVLAKSPVQEAYMNSMIHSQITFAIGPAGTGKTFLAVAYSLGELLSGRKQKIILTRPVVEAGESLGFLPGDLSQKLNPYLKPLYDNMEALIPPATVKRLEESGAIEISPLAYMRGRSLHNACVILDEAQNTTRGQMKMFLTRIGEDSCAIITGDVTQIDLPQRQFSGLLDARSVLNGVEGISFVEFSWKDTVRSRIVQRIINAYERNE